MIDFLENTKLKNPFKKLLSYHLEGSHGEELLVDPLPVRPGLYIAGPSEICFSLFGKGGRKKRDEAQLMVMAVVLTVSLYTSSSHLRAVKPP